jgi:hypothetical protein
VLTTGVFLWSLFTVLTPGAAAAGTVPLLAARVLLGVGEGVAFPSIHSMIGKQLMWLFGQQAHVFVCVCVRARDAAGCLCGAGSG